MLSCIIDIQNKNGGINMDTIKKIFKFIGILAAVAAFVAGVYALVKKLCDKKNCKCEDDKENYVSCSCCDADFVSEQAK